METTVVKGLSILEVLAASEQPCGISDIARACGMTKSNAHRLLKTLEECRYVRQDRETRAYQLTLKLWELGARVHNSFDVRRAALPHLRALALATGESVHLSVLEDGHAVYVETIDSTQPIRAYVRAGDRAPAYCVATGKTILAFQPDDVVAAACAEMPSYTPLTVTDRDALERDLARIRTNGYALTRGEWRAGVLGIAAPVRGSAGPAVAAVGIAGPGDRIRKAELPSLVALVLTAARAISEELGLHAEPGRVPPQRRAKVEASESLAAASRGSR